MNYQNNVSYYSYTIDRFMERLGQQCPRSIILDYEQVWDIKSDDILTRKLRVIKEKLAKLIDELSKQ